MNVLQGGKQEEILMRIGESFVSIHLQHNSVGSAQQTEAKFKCVFGCLFFLRGKMHEQFEWILLFIPLLY